MSWRGRPGRGGATANLRECFILLLLGDSDIAWRASPKTAIDEKLTQVLKRQNVNLCPAEPHADARGSVQHPARQHDNYTGGGFDVAQPSASSHFTVM
jgi:hypothetical protein